MKEHVEASNHSVCINKSKDPTSKVVWLIIAIASEYQNYQNHNTAIRYMTYALNVAFHLFESTRVEIFSQILKFWVPGVFQASKDKLKECGVSLEIGEKVAGILQTSKISTPKTINSLVSLIQDNCAEEEEDSQVAAKEEEKKNVVEEPIVVNEKSNDKEL